MVEISISGLTKYYGDRLILDDLSLEVYSGEKVALVGKNGAGKTTVFRILSGEEPFEAGHVSLAPGRRVGILSQLPVYPAGFTAGDVLRDAFAPLTALKAELEALETAMQTDHSRALVARYGKLSTEYEVRGGFDTETPLARVRAGLQIGDDLFNRPFDRLSGGEKTRINLARLILMDTDLLLLDEPTNHLDMKSIEWLEDYVARYKGTVMAVSHDRYFLDNVAGRVIELSGGKAASYSGNYSFYVMERDSRLETQRQNYEREQREKSRLLATARRMHDYAGGNDKLHRRAFAIEKRAQRVETTDRPPTEKTLHVRFGVDSFRAADVLRINELAKGFGKPLFAGVSLTVRGGERIGILGDNGTGKTTFMRILAQELRQDRGDVWRGPTVRQAYLPQLVEFAHPERTLLDTLLYEQDETTQNARDRLGRFHFTGEDVFKQVCSLSGGEKSRLMLCMLMKHNVNLLLLDEPTNHLDIASREWMEEAVNSFHETLLFISHDRYFIARFATRLWILENGGLTDFHGTFSEYRAREATLTPPSATRQDKTRPTPAQDAQPKRGKEQRVRDARLRALETDIEKKESRLKAIDGEMEQNATDPVSLTALLDEQEALVHDRDVLYAEWLSLSGEE